MYARFQNKILICGGLLKRAQSGEENVSVSYEYLFLHTESYRYKSSQVKLGDRVCVMDLYYESTAPKLLIS